MTPEEYWKNFDLGTELDISGAFIYNGLYQLHQMETLYYEDEIFEVLYNLSVGLERLFKITVILTEYDDKTDLKEFEEKIKTHDLLNLLSRVKDSHTINLSRVHSEFLELLNDFYKLQRYDRYNFSSDTRNKEKKWFHTYLEKHLSIKIGDKFPFDISPNTEQVKRFLGKVAGKIINNLYGILINEAHRNKIYTYEVRYYSKAGKIFLRKEYDFFNEEILWKELIIFLVNSKETSGHLGFIKQIESLQFDPEMDAEYLKSFSSNATRLNILDELESLYDDTTNRSERIDMLKLIGEPSVNFDDTEDDYFK